MRHLSHIGEWISEKLGELLRPFVAGELELLGITGAVAVLLAIWLAYFIARLLWSLVEPPPEIRWDRLDPDNEQLLKTSYADLSIVASLARELNEDAAETLDEFVGQIRRLNRFNQPTVWDRIDTNDQAAIEKLYGDAATVKAVASKLRMRRARSADEFRQQVRDMQTQSRLR